MSIEPIERRINWMQLNAIETQSNFTQILRLSNVIKSMEYYGNFQFDWFGDRSINRTNQTWTINRTQLDIITQKLAVWLRLIGSIAIFVWSHSIDIVWSYRSFIDHIDLLSILSKDRALISIDLNLWSILNRHLIDVDSRSIGNWASI